MSPASVLTGEAAQRLDQVETQLVALDLGSGHLPTDVQLRRAVLAYERASLTGRDDDLHTVRVWVAPVVADGGAHDDLALILVQTHLDSHALAEAEAVLEAYPRAAASSGGRSSRAAVLQQRGDVVAAGRVYGELAGRDPSWRTLAGLAGIYVELDDPVTADALLQLAVDDIDARHLSVLAWVEGSRARLHRQRGDLARADFHLRRAELAFGGWRVVEERARWHLEAGDAEAAVAALEALVLATGRPDHRHALAAALRRSGRADEAGGHFAAAARGYADAAAETPWRYLHHRVGWHLEVDGDLDEALRLARLDHEGRPSVHPVRELAEVHRRRGEATAANRLLDELARDQQAGRAELDETLQATVKAWTTARA